MKYVVYDSDSGEVKAVGENELPSTSNQSVVELDESNITEPITGTEVDDLSDPTSTIRNEDLAQPSELKRQRFYRELIEVERKIDGLKSLINSGDIPSRPMDDDLDEVLSTLETRYDELRGKIDQRD